MERDGRSHVITFFAATPLSQAATISLGEDAARHARVRRVREGDPARVVDGQGLVGEGQIAHLGRGELTLAIARVVSSPAPSTLEVIVPVADRDRMLLAAEKCAELQVTAWRPAYFERSRSVSPRGEGEKFRGKAIARMQAALEQSGGTWLPAVHEEAEFSEIVTAVTPAWTRVILDSSGTSFVSHISKGPMALAIGPEGGLEDDEIDRARSVGWAVASLGRTTLRFETAIIAAASVVRALQHSSDIPAHG